MTKYTDTTTIGRGGFGEVCRCVRDLDGREFAKKKLIDITPDAITRFTREVRLLGSLDHPNIVPVIAQHLADAPYFYIMPLYQQSLASIVRGLSKELDRIEGIFGRILDGIAYAHEQGVIHRDLKPLNVLLNDDSNLVVSDFGLGRQLHSESTRQTGTGYQMGTELYMAPEQFSDAKTADERSDVFSLGRILIELYAGFLSPGTQDTSCIPSRFLPIYHRATHHNPEKRFRSAIEMRNAWMQAIAIGTRTQGKQSLQALVAQYAADASTPDLSLDDLVMLLLSCSDDPDEIHAALMKLPIEIIALACDQHPEDMLVVISVFADLLEKQGWAFNYTDTLADRIVLICANMAKAEIKARLAVAVAIVGVDHNRWHVMSQAARLLEGADSDENEFAQLFASVPEATRKKIAAYLSMSKVPRRLRTLFEFDESK